MQNSPFKGKTSVVLNYMKNVQSLTYDSVVNEYVWNYVAKIDKGHWFITR